MITSLYIKNIALIKELKLNLTNGLNILSGETGAGKSIIIDSLNFVLGDRADKSLIRYGESSASVQVVFSADNLTDEFKCMLDDSGIERDDFLIIRRTMNENGKNECRINDTIVTLSALKRIVTALVDVHSQHEHQSLLSETNHIKILDNYSKETNELKDKLKLSLQAFRNAEKELKTYPSIDERARLMDILSFQINEISDAKIEEGEEEELIQERSRINNSKRIIEALSTSANNLSNDDGYSALAAIHTAIKELNSISKFREVYSNLAERLSDVKIELDDISATINSEAEDALNEAHDIEAVEKRLDVIRSIKKRFGRTLDEINSFLTKTRIEYDRLNFAEDRITQLESIISEESAEIIKICSELHKARVNCAIKFEKAIMLNLAELGMVGSIFSVDINYPEDDSILLAKVDSNGVDDVRFLISPNKGEPLRPLAKIASGGEMSRFMLGLKNITAELEGIDTLVFDEIDTGISGHIAKVVANKLYNIAAKRQVLAVTHLAQLAAMADTHYLITKKEEDNKTYTYVDPLTLDQSLKEIMRLTGADINSKSGLENAKELKQACDEYKKKLSKSNT
ncbi:MAG: DNA repair protein RecN [Christensenellaceae bacterium]|jgi:DNA repair protein RecN (Recombination protein N)|nr:DNA repair protein RecN [Christensenellaceae bacterium]